MYYNPPPPQSTHTDLFLLNHKAKCMILFGFILQSHDMVHSKGSVESITYLQQLQSTAKSCFWDWLIGILREVDVHRYAPISADCLPWGGQDLPGRQRNMSHKNMSLILLNTNLPPPPPIPQFHNANWASVGIPDHKLQQLWDALSSTWLCIPVIAGGGPLLCVPANMCVTARSKPYWVQKHMMSYFMIMCHPPTMTSTHHPKFKFKCPSMLTRHNSSSRLEN